MSGGSGGSGRGGRSGGGDALESLEAQKAELVAKMNAIPEPPAFRRDAHDAWAEKQAEISRQIRPINEKINAIKFSPDRVAEATRKLDKSILDSYHAAGAKAPSEMTHAELRAYNRDNLKASYENDRREGGLKNAGKRYLGPGLGWA